MAVAPDRLGKYHILELIAQGGMAEVYKAKTVGIAGFEKILALKRIKPQLANEPRFIRNFIDEARIAVSLNHRNIVQVFDFGKADGELFLAMELIEGADLRTTLKAAKAAKVRLPVGLACYVLSELAAGLDYAHRKRDASGAPLGIVHCDVSPQNIILSSEGFVKILDFGVARARFSAAPSTKRLRGKPRYMAPEQTLGESPTAAADVFALGILAWELLTGLPLFEGKDVPEILKAVRRADVPDPGKLNPDIPDYLARAILQALAREPENRGSASDLGTLLAQASRELSKVPSSRGMADWLSTLFPPDNLGESTSSIMAPRATIEEPVEVGDITVTRPRLALVSDMATDPMGEMEGELLDTEPSADQAAAGVRALIDKRRVVVTALLLDGPDATRRRELEKLLADLAYKRGAVLHETEPDVAIAVFGLEVAGEDDVASAMHFALDACELARSQSGPSTEVYLRIATRAGVVAQRRGDEYRLRGDAVQEARELARGAEPDRPLLSGGAGRLASAQFVFRELPARRYRSRRLRVLELVGPRDQSERASALRDRSGRFIGRQQELLSLWQCYDQARTHGRRECAVITGPTGVGKSRLAAEFVARCEHDGSDPVVVAVAATAAAAEAPFTLTIELLQTALSLSPGRGERARSALLQRLATLLREDGADEVELREVTGAIELAMELRDGAISGASNPSAAVRDRVVSSLRRFRQALAGQRPLVVVLEDLHAADRASLEVMRSWLVGGASIGPELVVLTGRRPPELVDELPDAAHIQLGELDSKEREELIRERLAEAGSAATVGAVERRAGGNPLYIEELARSVRDVGWSELPATVRDVILARVDRLSKPAKAVLQHASVIGTSFRWRILEELISAPAHHALQELVEEGLLLRSDQAGPEAEDGELTFRHGLIQEVVYDSLSAGARRATHERLGRLLVLRTESGRDEPPAQIARHLELGGALDEAAAYWVRAGHVALAASDATIARDAFARALELAADDDSELQRSALLGRERAHRNLGDHAAQVADLDALDRTTRGDPGHVAEVLSRRAESKLRTGDYDQVLEIAQRAVVAATQARSPLLEGEALRIMGEAHERMGEYDRGVELTQRALALFERIGARELEARARIDLARNHLVRARYAEAQSIYEPVLDYLEEAPNPQTERVVYNHLAAIHLCMGEYETAMRYADRALQLCEVDGDKARRGDNLSVGGVILMEVGQFEEAQKYFDAASALHLETQSRWSNADCLVYSAFNHAMMGNFETALQQLEGASREAKAIGASYVATNAAIARAGIYLLRDSEQDLERALDAAAAAADEAREASLTGAQAMALSRHAEALRRRGASERGLAMVKSALRILERKRHIEGSEEEILYHGYLLCAECEDPAAGGLLERARRSLDRKLSGIERPDWRESFCTKVPIHRAILAATGGA